MRDLAETNVTKLSSSPKKQIELLINPIDPLGTYSFGLSTSGIRVKLPTESPALVAMVHLPILGKEKRTISIKEAARLQSFPEDFKFNELPQHAYKQLGNAVNVKVIETVFKQFLDYIGCELED